MTAYGQFLLGAKWSEVMVRNDEIGKFGVKIVLNNPIIN